MEESLKEFRNGITKFAGLDGMVSFVTLKDPGTSNPSFHSKTDISIMSKSGKASVTAQKYMDLMECFQPDIFHTLCDGDTNMSSGKKRVINAVNRTESFFDECLERYKQSDVLRNSLLIGIYTQI